jgi:hypothetical protein
MRLCEINDQVGWLPNEKIIWENIIAHNCTEALYYYEENGKMLYRGTSPKGPFFQGESRTDRRPLNLAIEQQQAIDKLYQTNGVKAKRSNSIFATSRCYGYASSYGTPYIIFPYDDAAWSYTKFSDLYDALEGGDYEKFILTNDEFKNPDQVWQYLQVKSSDHGDTIRQALTDNLEVLISGKYYAVLVESPFATKIARYLNCEIM